jgi:hypothetical protein
MNGPTNKILLLLASLTADVAREVKSYRKLTELAPGPEAASRAAQFQLVPHQLETQLGQAVATGLQISAVLQESFTTVNKRLATQKPTPFNRISSRILNQR